MEQRIIGTVIDVEPRDAYACFVEIECKALEDATAFQIVSTDLPFEHVALHEAAGSRLKLICAPGLKVDPGEKVKIAVKPFERSALRRRGSENALGPAEQGADQTSNPVGTFAGPGDVNVRSREGHAAPQDTGTPAVPKATSALEVRLE